MGLSTWSLKYFLICFPYCSCSRDKEVAPEKEAVPDVPLPSTGNPQLDELVRAAVQAQMKQLTEKLTDLHHSLEHQLSGEIAVALRE